VQSITVPAGAGTFTFSNVAWDLFHRSDQTRRSHLCRCTPPQWLRSGQPDDGGPSELPFPNDSISNQNFGLFTAAWFPAQSSKTWGRRRHGEQRNMDGAEPGIVGITVKADHGGATTYDYRANRQ